MVIERCLNMLSKLSSVMHLPTGALITISNHLKRLSVNRAFRALGKQIKYDERDKEELISSVTLLACRHQELTPFLTGTFLIRDQMVQVQYCMTGVFSTAGLIKLQK